MTSPHTNTPTTTTTTTAVAAVSAASICGHCGIEEHKFLHNVRLRGNFRRLCTTCVLRLHPQCFCPSCFGVYDRTPPDDAVVCYKCYSSSHPSCVSLSVQQGSVTSARGPTPCASCLNPNLLVLNLNREENDETSDDKKSFRCIDMDAARLLLCAGKIAAVSMNKAEVAAGMEADRRAKEAAFTKKRAKEALDHVVTLMMIEKRSSNNIYNKKRVNVNVNNVVVKDKKVVESSVVLETMKESGSGHGSVAMDVDGVNGKDLGSGSVIDSVVENGDVVEGEKACNGEKHGLEKVHGLVENGVVKPKN